MTDSRNRQILLVPHTGRAANIAATVRAAEFLLDSGFGVRICARETVVAGLEHVAHSPQAAEDCELVLVLGGDGTVLRGADIARAVSVPVLGINLGHVGFLAEWEVQSLDRALARVAQRSYRIEDRMTVDIQVYDEDGSIIGQDWALNEVSLESNSHIGVLDAVLEVDGRPVSAFGCDGVIISTPTGSTAYAFSAGGPVLWPELDAMLVVPNNAHALFTRPLVVAPQSVVAVESAPTTAAATAVMDGFRQLPMPPGGRLEVRRGTRPVRWVKLDDKPFTDRLVTKLRLPVEGWRGPLERPDCERDDATGQE